MLEINELTIGLEMKREDSCVKSRVHSLAYAVEPGIVCKVRTLES